MAVRHWPRLPEQALSINRGRSSLILPNTINHPYTDVICDNIDGGLFLWLRIYCSQFKVGWKLMTGSFFMIIKCFVLHVRLWVLPSKAGKLLLHNNLSYQANNIFYKTNLNKTDLITMDYKFILNYKPNMHHLECSTTNFKHTTSTILIHIHRINATYMYVI